jgi:hypothetical protein
LKHSVTYISIINIWKHPFFFKIEIDFSGGCVCFMRTSLIMYQKIILTKVWSFWCVILQSFVLRLSPNTSMSMCLPSFLGNTFRYMLHMKKGSLGKIEIRPPKDYRLMKLNLIIHMLNFVSHFKLQSGVIIPAIFLTVFTTMLC